MSHSLPLLGMERKPSIAIGMGMTFCKPLGLVSLNPKHGLWRKNAIDNFFANFYFLPIWNETKTTHTYQMPDMSSLNPSYPKPQPQSQDAPKKKIHFPITDPYRHVFSGAGAVSIPICLAALRLSHHGRWSNPHALTKHLVENLELKVYPQHHPGVDLYLVSDFEQYILLDEGSHPSMKTLTFMRVSDYIAFITSFRHKSHPRSGSEFPHVGHDPFSRFSYHSISRGPD